MRYLIFSCLFCFLALKPALSQNFSITGKILDNDSKQPLPGVYVTLRNGADSSLITVIMTDASGVFTFPNLSLRRRYIVTTSFLGYGDIYRRVYPKQGVFDLGTMVISPVAKNIGMVIVKGDPPASQQRGDTTEMNAGAFKVNKDATAEDLVTKMPGVTIQNGTYVAHGEQITKVLVDGKPFFGDDPAVTLKNLPAEVIDKVQIFNKLSEQAELTGFDDGNSQKTMNIVTRQNRRNGVFGKAFVGAGIDSAQSDRYLLGVNMNYFKQQLRFSVLSLANNINQQNFASQDLISNAGGNGRNFAVVQQPGITTTGSIGGNYTNAWGKKVNVTASYFFNYSKNTYLEDQVTNNFSQEQLIMSPTQSEFKNFNNRFNMRLEWDPDTMDIFIMTPRISFQNNFSGTTTYSDVDSLRGNFFDYSKWNNSYTYANGNNISDELVYRRKFNKARRTISISLTPTFTSSNSSTAQTLTYRTSFDPTDSLYTNYFTGNSYPSSGVSANLAYTEPAGKNGMFQLSYNYGYTFTRANFSFDTVVNGMNRQIDSLSSVYQSTYVTNRPGISYRLKMDKLNFSIGSDFQRAELSGALEYPYPGSITKVYFNLLPNMLLQYRSGTQSNLRIYYRATTSAPSVTQLQDVLNVTNYPNISIGNAGLQQQYSHNVMGRYMISNPDKNLTLSGFFGLTYTLNPVEYQRISNLLVKQDTVVYNEKIAPGGSLSVPINMNDAYTIRYMVNFGFPLPYISSKMNIITGLNYSLNPGSIEMIESGPNHPLGPITNINRTSALTNGVVIGSNISEQVDFTLSYTNTYNTTNNSTQSKGNASYMYQTCSGKINLLTNNGFLFETDALLQMNTGLSQGFNQKYVLWNASIGKKFLKKQSGELKLSVYDLLNDAKNISWTTTALSTTDNRYNTLPGILC